MGFSRSHNNELNSLERGRAGADTPMSIQDFDLPMSIRDDAVSLSIQVFDVPMSNQDFDVPMSNQDFDASMQIKAPTRPCQFGTKIAFW